MKRAFLTLVALVAILLAYPSTQSVAGQSPYSSGPVITKPVSGGTGPIGVDGSDEDNGDADGLSGHSTKINIEGFAISSGTRVTSGADVQWVLLKTWWKYFIWFR
jgi:hypothetical protein